LRLVLLFALRYNGDDKVNDLVRELESEKIPNVKLVDSMLKYVGKERKKVGLGSEGGLVDRFAKVFKEAFKGIPNVFTQHKSQMSYIIEAIEKGTLKDLDFPCTTLDQPKEKIDDIIVFIVGGATYQEAREVCEYKNKGLKVLLGSSNMHNSTSYLADITFLHGQAPVSSMISLHPEEFKSF